VNRHPGWNVRWVESRSGFQAREVFTSPEGIEYRRTKDPELADVTLATDVGPLYLRRRDANLKNLRVSV